MFEEVTTTAGAERYQSVQRVSSERKNSQAANEKKKRKRRLWLRETFTGQGQFGCRESGVAVDVEKRDAQVRDFPGGTSRTKVID